MGNYIISALFLFLWLRNFLIYRGRRYRGFFFKSEWPGFYLKVNRHLTNDQKQFFTILHFSSIAGQKTEKIPFFDFWKKYSSYSHKFYAQIFPIPYYLICKKIPIELSLLLAVDPKNLKKLPSSLLNLFFS